MPLVPVQSGVFRRDVKRAKKRGKDMAELRTVLTLLVDQQPCRRHTAITRSRAIGAAIETCISSPTGC